MSDTLIVALISLVGTLIGTIGGIAISNNLVNYRITQLEKEVKEHNKYIERTYVLEGAVKELQHEVIELKKGV
ncbi:MAG: hypothetical protein J6R88_01465 [Clostridia bacterium]|nr:hypothetical protein [Clostridia bacterium]